jgi:hypothetical protein
MSLHYSPKRVPHEITMKSLQPVFFCFAMTLLGCLFATTAVAQNTWVGGTPGAETDWEQPSNWSDQRVPDWTDQLVIIANVSTASGHFPIVDTAVPEVPCLQINAGAQLTVTENGHLVINGETTHNYGLLNIGRLYNAGQLTIEATALAPLADRSNLIENYGAIVIHSLDDQEPPTARAGY